MKTFCQSVIANNKAAKKFSLFIVMFLMVSMVCNAAIRRVGFFAAPVAGVDYATFALAYNASAAGDTGLCNAKVCKAWAGTFSNSVVMAWLQSANAANPSSSR